MSFWLVSFVGRWLDIFLVGVVVFGVCRVVVAPKLLFLPILFFSYSHNCCLTLHLCFLSVFFFTSIFALSCDFASVVNRLSVASVLDTVRGLSLLN